MKLIDSNGLLRNVLIFQWRKGSSNPLNLCTDFLLPDCEQDLHDDCLYHLDCPLDQMIEYWRDELGAEDWYSREESYDDIYYMIDEVED